MSIKHSYHQFSFTAAAYCGIVKIPFDESECSSILSCIEIRGLKTTFHVMVMANVIYWMIGWCLTRTYLPSFGIGTVGDIIHLSIYFVQKLINQGIQSGHWPHTYLLYQNYDRSQALRLWDLDNFREPI